MSAHGRGGAKPQEPRGGASELDGEGIVRRLEVLRREGTDLDELLRETVRLIEAAEECFHWVGIYLLDGEELVLHNYIGRLTEHDRIAVGVGVCGTAVAEGRDINVPDVKAVENYLACSVETASELVVLIRAPESDRILGQLDLDSDRRAAFRDRDERELRKVARWLGALLA